MSGNRLTPPPDARTRLARDDQPIGPDMMAGWQKENQNVVRQALNNKCEFLVKYDSSLLTYNLRRP